MPTKNDNLAERDYDTTRLANFEDGPVDDVAADLATLLGRKARPQPAPPAPPPTAATTAGPSTTNFADPPTRMAPPDLTPTSPRADSGPGASAGEGRSTNGRAQTNSPRRTRTSVADTGAANVSTKPKTSSRPTSSRPTSRRRTSGPDGEPGDLVSRILYLPVDLVESLRVYRATSFGVSNTQIALSALNAHYQQVDDLIDATAGDRVINAGPLFEEVVSERQIPKRQVEITPTREQLQIIDGIVGSSHAKDRSQLFTVVIQRWLADRTSSQRT